MNKIILSCLVFGVTFNSVVAQNQNLVENGSFEDIKGKIKKEGAIGMSVGWISPTKEQADIYSDRIAVKLGIPNNFNGKEDAYDGSYYAGFSAFSYGNKEPRSYVSTKLVLPMRAGQKYCVKFYVSLAESSKYAANNIAANFSKRQYNIETNKNITGEAHVAHMYNPVFDELFGWNEVCGVFRAEGGEKFLTIGNFGTNGSTESARIKKPSDFKGTQSIRAYYYLDNVSVELIDDESQCECEAEVEKEEDSFVYAVSAVNIEGMSPVQAMKYTTVYFGYDDAMVSLNAEEHLANVVKVMNANPESRIKLEIHMDEDEVADEYANTVDVKRSDSVIKYLVEQGISATRISVENLKADMPSDTSGSEIGKAKNRRISFVFMK